MPVGPGTIFDYLAKERDDHVGVQAAHRNILGAGPLAHDGAAEAVSSDLSADMLAQRRGDIYSDLIAPARCERCEM